MTSLGHNELTNTAEHSRDSTGVYTGYMESQIVSSSVFGTGVKRPISETICAATTFCNSYFHNRWKKMSSWSMSSWSWSSFQHHDDDDDCDAMMTTTIMMMMIIIIIIIIIILIFVVIINKNNNNSSSSSSNNLYLWVPDTNCQNNQRFFIYRPRPCLEYEIVSQEASFMSLCSLNHWTLYHQIPRTLKASRFNFLYFTNRSNVCPAALQQRCRQSTKFQTECSVCSHSIKWCLSSNSIIRYR